MNLKKKIVMCLSLLISCYLFYPKVEAIGHSKEKTYTIDHDKDQKKAKKWAEKEYNSWKKTLTSAEKISLQELLKPPQEEEADNLQNINHQLKVYGGDLSARAVDTQIENKSLQDHIHRISRAINRKEGRLDKPLIVYKNESLQDVLHTRDEYFRNPDHTLDQVKVGQLKTDFLVGLHSEFRIYDLFEDPDKNEMIKWRIELPAGTKTGLITEDQIVIDKDSAFKVNDVTIITKKGKQLIRINAKVIPKEIVKGEIKQITDQLQQDFNDDLDLPFYKKFIDFKLTGAASFIIAKNLEDLLDEFISAVEPEIVSKILQFMSEKKGYITLTDRKLYTLPIVYEPDERVLKDVVDMMDAGGCFNKINRTLAVHLPENMEKKQTGTPDILLHEFGHAVEHYSAQILQLPEERISDIREFQKIFAKEGKNLTEYGSTNSSEFFAEAFWMMHTEEHQPTVKEKAPLAYLFILQVLEFIDNHEPDFFDIAS